MHWPPDIAGDLPAPRDDEPSSLRQDIADELGDHLQCAFTRDLHRTGDEKTARHHALDRFGDPRAIARKLWFDALRDKIMTQRMMFVGLVVVLLASLGSSGATWFLIQQAQRANEAMLTQSREATAEILAQSRDANKALVEQTRQANAALITKLGELSSGTRGPTEPVPSLEWNSVKCRLYSGEKPGQPAAGFLVTLTGFVLDTAKEVTVQRTTDGGGMADLGLIRPGQHLLTITAPWGDTRKPMRITVLPGQSLLEEVPCPVGRQVTTDLSFVVDWPDDLKDKGYWIVAHFASEPRTVAGVEWIAANRENEFVVVSTAAGKKIRFPLELEPPRPEPRSDRPYRRTASTWPFEVRRVYSPSGEFGLRLFSAQTLPERLTANYGFVIPDISEADSFLCQMGEYRLKNLLVTGSPPEALKSTGRVGGFGALNELSARLAERAGNTQVWKLPVRGGLITRFGSSSGWSRTVPQSSLPTYSPLIDWIELPSRAGTESGVNPRLSSTGLEQARAESQPTFVANADGKTEWTISLPPLLQETIRANPDFGKEIEAASKAE